MIFAEVQSSLALLVEAWPVGTGRWWFIVSWVWTSMCLDENVEKSDSFKHLYLWCHKPWIIRRLGSRHHVLDLFNRRSGLHLVWSQGVPAMVFDMCGGMPCPQSWGFKFWAGAKVAWAFLNRPLRMSGRPIVAQWRHVGMSENRVYPQL